MKRLLFVLAAASLLAFSACTGEDPVPAEDEIEQNTTDSPDNPDTPDNPDNPDTPDPPATVTVTEVSLDVKNHSFFGLNDNLALTATVQPENATDPSISWSSADENIATVDKDGKVTPVGHGIVYIRAKANDESGKADSCRVRVMLGTCPEDALDLGLSVFWGKRNLGASKIDDYGNFYAWGETSTKDLFYWMGYKYGTDYNKLTKYNTDPDYGTVDGKTSLEPEDDAAHAALGANWRMPSVAEFEELVANCSWKHYTNTNSINVVEFTSKMEGYKGVSILLPCAGYHYSKPDRYEKQNSIGYYLSNEIDTRAAYEVYHLVVSSTSPSMKSSPKAYGHSIRPVSE